jgi:hypothetical protein
MFDQPPFGDEIDRIPVYFPHPIRMILWVVLSIL